MSSLKRTSPDGGHDEGFIERPTFGEGSSFISKSLKRSARMRVFDPLDINAARIGGLPTPIEIPKHWVEPPRDFLDEYLGVEAVPEDEIVRDEDDDEKDELGKVPEEEDEEEDPEEILEEGNVGEDVAPIVLSLDNLE